MRSRHFHSPRTMHGPTWPWVASKFLQTALPKGSLNASKHCARSQFGRCSRLIGLAKVFYGSRAETEGSYPRGIPPLSSRYRRLPVDADCGRSQDAARRGCRSSRLAPTKHRGQPQFSFAHFGFAAALGLLGSLDEARAAAKAGLALDPDFTIRRFRAGASSDNPTYLAGRERICMGMRMAGVPEG